MSSGDKAAQAAAEAEQARYDAESIRQIEQGHLPLRAQERLRQMSGRAFTSELSVPAFALVHGSGFDPVGQVLGTCVYHLGWASTGCGYYGSYGNYGYTGYSGYSSRNSYGSISVVDVTDRVRALRDATARALGRLAAEARGLGADGVVDVTLTWQGFAGVSGALEVQALGTAVRGRGTDLRHLGSPFLSDMSGQDISLLLRSGWVPTGIVVGIAVCVRHDDYWTRQSATTWAGNTEIPGVTELINETRHRSRQAAARDVAALGGTACVVKAMSLRTWEQEPAESHRDHLAEASVVGTALVQIHKGKTPAIPPTLPIMRLNGARAGDVRRESQ